MSIKDDIYIEEPDSIFSNHKDNKKVLYINSDYGKLKRKDYRIEFYKGHKLKASFPSKKIDKIILIGNISFTPQLLDLLLFNNISICFLNRKGHYRGTVISHFSKNSILRYNQFLISATDIEKKLFIAKSICDAKIKHIIYNIKRRIKEKKLDNTAYEKIDRLKNLINSVDNAKNNEQLLGIEGTASRIYFSEFNNFILNPDFIFNGRSKRPPKDNVNAMLSFGYTLLINDFISLLYATGFDPYFGFFHKLRYGNPCLALDMVEPFRPLFIDNLVFYIINNKILNKFDFENRDNGVFLSKHGIDIFLYHYNERKNKITKFIYNKKRLRVNQLFQFYIYQLANFIMKKNNTLNFYIKV